MIRHVLVALPFSFAAVAAHAVIRIGNGGDAVVCRHLDGEKKIQTATLLDLYESEAKRWSLEGDHEKRLGSLFDKLEAVSPEQARAYRRRLKEMANEIDFREGIKLVDIKDSEHLIAPVAKGCAIEQAAARRNVVDADGKRFLIDRAVWNAMDETSKAGLLLHEIVYEHLFKLGEKNSVKARQLVGYYLSEDFRGADREAYWKRIEKLRLPLYR